ncbi:hypothetical protein EAE90_22970 [Photorhabdus caribbeanensis]|nr:hypothetical protein [Photorhabdus caribbeanensis]
METVNLAKSAVPNSRKINGKPLTGDVSLNAGDVGAFPGVLFGVTDNGRFSDASENGIYIVYIANPNSVTDLPAYNNVKIYSYGFLVVFKNNDQQIHQTYYSHQGDIATRQTWGGPGQYLPWTIQYSTKNKPTAEDVGVLSGKQYISSLTVQTSAWVKIAEVTMKVMSTININIAGGSGYNVGNFEQCAITNIVLRTGNGYPNGINAVMYTVNTNAPTDLATVNTSGDNYDIYIFIGPFAQNIILNAFVSDNATVNQLIKMAELSEVPNGAVKGRVYSYLLSGRESEIYPIGAPIPWPLPNVPAGYLACNGQSFNKSLYPKLAAAYPSGVLPDLRGEFIRGWDDGRGVDSGRGILSWQPQQVQWHQHLGGHGGRSQGAFGVTNLAGHPGSYHDDSKQTLPFTNNGSDFQGFTNNGAVGAETRPRNIAFNYIVRAA